MSEDSGHPIGPIDQLREKRRDCFDKGHLNAFSYGITQLVSDKIPRVNMFCPDCRMFYQRDITQKELKDYRESLDTFLKT